MKKILFLFFMTPFFGLAQLSYNDLQYLADHKSDKNIDYITKKGYTYRSEREIGDGSKNLYYEKGKLSSTLVVMRVGPKLNNLISYVPETEANYNAILNSVKDAKFQLSDSTVGKNDKCSIYTSTLYYSKFCEVKFSKDANTSYNITFYRSDVHLFD